MSDHTQAEQKRLERVQRLLVKALVRATGATQAEVEEAPLTTAVRNAGLVAGLRAELATLKASIACQDCEQARRAMRRKLESAVNASCSCGGKGPDDGACLACMVWHRYEGQA